MTNEEKSGRDTAEAPTVRCWVCKHDVPEPETKCVAGVGTSCIDRDACRARQGCKGNLGSAVFCESCVGEMHERRSASAQPVYSVPALPINEEDQRMVDRVVRENTPKGTTTRRLERRSSNPSASLAELDEAHAFLESIGAPSDIGTSGALADFVRERGTGSAQSVIVQRDLDDAFRDGYSSGFDDGGGTGLPVRKMRQAQALAEWRSHAKEKP